MAFFISVEGIDGSGKTTQIRLLAEWLEHHYGQQTVVTREPGGCSISDKIREILLDTKNLRMNETAELLMYAASRAQHVAEVIRPALQRGEIVICDRFIDATVAYQGYGRGLSMQNILKLNDFATDGTTPDLTLLLDLDPRNGLHRARERNAAAIGPDEGRFEQENLDFHLRVRQGYRDLAAEHARIEIIDAAGSVEEVARRIRRQVAARINAEPISA